MQEGPLTGLAIGYPSDPASLPENLRQRAAGRPPRKPLAAFVFGGHWGTMARVVSDWKLSCTSRKIFGKIVDNRTPPGY
jgi:hypothetical protein